MPGVPLNHKIYRLQAEPLDGTLTGCALLQFADQELEAIQSGAQEVSYHGQSGRGWCPPTAAATSERSKRRLIRAGTLSAPTKQGAPMEQHKKMSLLQSYQDRSRAAEERGVLRRYRQVLLHSVGDVDAGQISSLLRASKTLVDPRGKAGKVRKDGAHSEPEGPGMTSFRVATEGVVAPGVTTHHSDPSGHVGEAFIISADPKKPLVDYSEFNRQDAKREHQNAEMRRKLHFRHFEKKPKEDPAETAAVAATAKKKDQARKMRALRRQSRGKLRSSRTKIDKSNIKADDDGRDANTNTRSRRPSSAASSASSAPGGNQRRASRRPSSATSFLSGRGRAPRRPPPRQRRRQRRPSQIKKWRNRRLMGLIEARLENLDEDESPLVALEDSAFNTLAPPPSARQAADKPWYAVEQDGETIWSLCSQPAARNPSFKKITPAEVRRSVLDRKVAKHLNLLSIGAAAAAAPSAEAPRAEDYSTERHSTLLPSPFSFDMKRMSDRLVKAEMNMFLNTKVRMPRSIGQAAPVHSGEGGHGLMPWQ